MTSKLGFFKDKLKELDAAEPRLLVFGSMGVCSIHGTGFLMFNLLCCNYFFRECSCVLNVAVLAFKHFGDQNSFGGFTSWCVHARVV